MISGISPKKIECVIFIIVALSPLAMGSVHMPVVFVFLCALSLIIIHQYKFGSLKSSAIGWVSLFISAVCAIQLIPLPAFLSLGDVGLYAEAMGVAPPWRPLSLEPFQTADRGLRFLTIGLLGFSVSSVARGKFYRRANFWMLVAGWVVLAFGLFLWLSQTTTFFGFEQSVRFRSVSPFVNTNHGATYFALLTLGAILHFENGKSKPFSVISGLCFLTVFILHGSVGVDLGFACVVALYACLKLRPNSQQLIKIAIATTTFLSFLVLIFWLDILPADAINNLITQSNTRLEVTHGGIRLAQAWPLFGAGMGSTDTSVLAQMDWTQIRPASIPTLENEFLEFFGTGGILVGLLILGAHLFLSFDALKTAVLDRKKRRHRWNALFWIFFLFIVSFHFPWFTLGLAFPFVLFIEGTSTQRITEFNFPGKFVALLSVLVVVFLVSFFVWKGRSDLNARPLASTIWTDLATKNIKNQNFTKALVYAEQAKALDPRPRSHHYLARIVAKRGNVERSIGLYRFAFTHGNIKNRIITDMLADVKNAADRNRILENQSDEVWLRAARISQNFFNEDQAIALAFDAIQNGHHEKAAKRFAAEVFIELKQTELARIWTETQGVEGSLLTSIYLEQNDFDSFFKTAQATQDAKNLPLFYILKNQNKILKTDTQRGGALLKRVYNEYCKTPLDAGRAKICWQVDASLKLENGDLGGAEAIYRRIFNRSGNPLQLGAFYLRVKKCSQIKELVERQTKENLKNGLSNLFRKCTQH